MRNQNLEPGLLSVFRWFIGLEAGLYVISELARSLQIEPAARDTISFWWLFPYDVALLVLLLWVPWFQRRMGKFFLPVAILIATAGPILRQLPSLVVRVNMQTAGFVPPQVPITPTRPDLFEISAQVGAWQLIPILFVPLVLIAWQYRFRVVAIFCILTAGADASILYFFSKVYNLRVFNLSGVIGIRTISFILVGYMVSRLIANQRTQQHALTEANIRLLDYTATLEHLSTSRERNRLAHELHDTLAHTLSSVSVQLEAVRTLWDIQPEQAHQTLEKALQSTRSGLTETRRALKALQATPLEDLGLALAIRELAESAAQRGSIELNLELTEQIDNLTPVGIQCIYRTTQEALENVLRHAQAHKIDVRLKDFSETVTLEVIDDGAGFDPNDVDVEEHFGLRGMRERAIMAGATLRVLSQPGHGTTVQLEVQK